MPPNLWTHDFMDEMRMEMDPLADTVIERLFGEGAVDAVDHLMRTLVENDDLLSSRLPPYVRDFLARTQADVSGLDREKLRRGQEIFELFGPEVTLILGFYSLPTAYAARTGVQVLYRTGFLQKRSVRRFVETAQMVVDVMTEGGLEPEGRGVRTLEKVRLMHAAIRHMIRHDPTWDAQELGQPINQEDLAGTLMTFAYVVLEGLKMLHIQLSPEQQESWLYAWVAAGRILGVDPRLLPASVEEARQLTFLIRQRQIAWSQEGVAMMAAHVEGLRQLTSDILDGLPEIMIHFFLDQDLWQGLNVADMLQVPKPDSTAIIPRQLRPTSKRLVEGMLLWEGRGQRTRFSIPKHLQERWALEPVARAAPPQAAPDAKTDFHKVVA